MTYVIDFTKAGLIDSVKRFGWHAVVVAALAGATDIYTSIQHIDISKHTAIATLVFAMVSSGIHNLLIWVGTAKVKADKSLPPVTTEFSGDIPQAQA